MAYIRRVRLEWNNLLQSETEFKTFFEQMSGTLSFLELTIKEELEKLCKRREGLQEYIVITSRVKKWRSAYNKFRKIEWSSKIKNFESNDSLYLHEIIQDLVGVRIICLGFDSQEKIIGEIINSRNISISSGENYSTHSRSSIFSNNERMREKLDKSSAEFGYKKKQTLYESIHLNITLPNILGDFELNRSELIPIEVQSSIPIDIRRAIPIEVQIRLMTEHIWASDEHSILYSPRKFSVNLDNNYEEEMRELFQALKYSCHSIERIRQKINDLSKAKRRNDLILTGRSYSSENILSYFEEGSITRESLQKLLDEFQNFQERDKLDTSQSLIRGMERIHQQHMQEYNDDLFQVADNNRSDDSNSRLNEEANTNINIDSQISEHEHVVSEVEAEYITWGKKRVVFILMGYWILRSNELIVKENYDFIKIMLDWGPKIEEMNLFLEDNPQEDSYLSVLNKYKVARNIFDRIQIKDLTCYKLAKKAGDFRFFIFNDPVVYFRLASSRYLDSDFAGAASIMNDYFNGELYDEEFDWKTHHNRAPDKKSFYLRWGQSIWFSCHLDASNIGSKIEDILDKFIEAIDDRNDRITLDAMAWYVIVYYYSFYFDVLGSDNIFLSNIDGYIERVQSFPSNNNAIRNIFNVFIAIKNEQSESIANVQSIAFNSIKELEEKNNHPSLVINQYKIMLKNLQQNFSHIYSNSQRDDIIFISYDKDNRDVVLEILNYLRKDPRFLRTRFWDYKDNIVANELILSNTDSPIKFSKAAILFVSDSYITNQDLLSEKFSIVDKKIKDSNNYQIIPILIGVNHERLMNHFQQLPQDYLNHVEYRDYDVENIVRNIMNCL